MGWDEERFLQQLALAPSVITDARQLCETNGTTLEAELLAGEHVSEEAFYGGIAEFLQLPFLPDIDVDLIEDRADLDLLLRHPYLIKLRPPHSPVLTALPPRLVQMEKLARDVASSASIRSRLVITTPGAIRRVVWKKGQARRASRAALQLFETRPQMSARITLEGAQGFALGLVVAGSVAIGLAVPGVMGRSLHCRSILSSSRSTARPRWYRN